MATRTDKLRVIDPVLTTIARGYSNSEFIGDKLFPFVNVEKSGGKIPTFGKEAFRVFDAKRAPAAVSNRMRPAGISTVDYATSEYDLFYPVDYLVDKEALIDQEMLATNLTTEGIRLIHEKAAADLAQDPDNYATANKETLTGSDQFSHADSKPIDIVREKKEALRALIGKRPNSMFMGAKVYDTLANHPTILARIANSQTQVGTLDLLKNLFEVPNIYVGEALYTDDDATFTDIWSDNLILAYITSPSGFSRTPYLPSFGYTLRLNGFPFVDKWETEGGKVTNVRSTDNWGIKVVGAESAYLISDVLA